MSSNKASETGRRFAVFHVTEHGESVHFLAEENLELLPAAVRLREYIRNPPEDATAWFLGMFPRAERITAEEFDACARERLDNTGIVAGAFDIDLDKGIFDALHIMDGWQQFRIQDVCTAASCAMEQTDVSWDERWMVFLDRLDGKQLTDETEAMILRGRRELRSGDISFSEDVMQSGNLLEFYMDVCFDADSVFGTHVCTSENDDYLNIYANYDLERGCVCDTLEVYLMLADGSELDYKYRLSEAEQEILLPRMEEYCEQQFGCGLDELRTQHLFEQSSGQQSPQM